MLARGEVGEVGTEARRRVMHVDANAVAGAHQEVLGVVRVYRSEIRRREGPGEKGICRGLGDTVLRDVGPVDRLRAAEDVLVAGLVVLCAVPSAGVLVE